MKLGKNKAVDTAGGLLSRPAVNQSKKNALIIAVVAVTFLMIAWVFIIGQKAEKTVQVVMLAQNIYKNQVITEDMLKPYDVLKGEFDKYAVVNENGVKKRRLILWKEKDKLINTFSAYPLMKDTYAEYRNFIKSRTDNSDNVLYSFPGKEILQLNIGQQDLQSFKTFLMPGDRLNIQAVFSEKMTVLEDDGYGNKVKNQIETFRTETVFGDIMVADLLNSQGESILDIYAGYRDLTVWEQAKLDVSQSFKDKTEPKTLLIALTPEEKDRYYYYVSKSNVTFKVSMPQRIE